MNESEIRPQAIFDEYLRLAANDADTYFGESERIFVPCPACKQVGKTAFVKAGFAYEHCESCLTLYVSPRPVAASFQKYYKEAPSVEFWATHFYRETAEARREKLWKPKAQKVSEILAEHAAQQSTVVDIGGGYGIFIEELQRLGHKSSIIIEPGPMLAEVCKAKGLTVIEKFLEEIDVTELPSSPKAFVSFELFEHLYDPESFFLDLHKLMQNGDLFVFTTLSGSGIDIQVLWENSKSVSPPHHLNFFNPSSVKLILERTGFEQIQVTTPGQLDMDILRNNVNFINDRFWKTVIQHSDDAVLDEWQSFIVEKKLSSHMMVVCRAKK